MNRDKVFLADPYAEIPTYILFKQLILETKNVEICIKTDDQYLITPLSMLIWKNSGNFKPILPNDPPILFNAPMHRQLFSSNSEEVKNLYLEAIDKGAFIQIEDNVIEISVFDLRKAFNVLDSESNPLNRWVVYDGLNFPDFRQACISKFYGVVKR